MTAYGYAACGMILAGCAAYAASVLHDRRRDRRPTRWQRQALKSPPVSFPDWDTIQLRDDEEDAFADLMVGYFQRADAS